MSMKVRGEVFLTSDTHIGHRRILEYQPNRLFKSIEEHDNHICTMWNNTVPPEATVFHLGDFFFYQRQKDYLRKLNGNIILIKGNHDSFNLGIPTHDLLEINYEGQSVVLCHYPIESWNKRHHGSYHFHGHTHGRLGGTPLRRDIGVDTNAALRPYNLKELINDKRA